MNTCPNENSEVAEQGSRHHHMLSAATQRLSGAGLPCGGKSRFQVHSVGDLWHKEAGGRLTRNMAAYVISLGSIFDFFWWVLNWKLGRGSKETEKLTVICQVLTILGQLLQELRVGQNSIITRGLAIVCCYVFDCPIVMVSMVVKLTQKG